MHCRATSVLGTLNYLCIRPTKLGTDGAEVSSAAAAADEQAVWPPAEVSSAAAAAAAEQADWPPPLSDAAAAAEQADWPPPLSDAAAAEQDDAGAAADDSVDAAWQERRPGGSVVYS